MLRERTGDNGVEGIIGIKLGMTQILPKTASGRLHGLAGWPMRRCAVPDKRKGWIRRSAIGPREFVNRSG